MTLSDFEVIYRTHAKTVYYYLMSLCHDEALSEELAQETMFRAVMNISSLRDDSKALAWLCQIAKNLYFEHLKKRKRLVSLDDIPASTRKEMMHINIFSFSFQNPPSFLKIH